MGLANKLEEMRKEGGDQWLSIWNADATKVRYVHVLWRYIVYNTLLCSIVLTLCIYMYMYN